MRLVEFDFDRIMDDTCIQSNSVKSTKDMQALAIKILQGNAEFKGHRTCVARAGRF